MSSGVGGESTRGGPIGSARGQAHGERLAGARAAPQPHVAAVVGQHVLDDGEPEPRAPGGPGAGRVDAEEPLEHAGLMLRVGDTVEIAVTDRGIGIAPQSLCWYAMVEPSGLHTGRPPSSPG